MFAFLTIFNGFCNYELDSEVTLFQLLWMKKGSNIVYLFSGALQNRLENEKYPDHIENCKVILKSMSNDILVKFL